MHFFESSQQFTKKTFQVLKAHSAIVAFVTALLLAGFLHGYNMFHYPYFESDEGTYLSQAYAVKEYGELSLYTYWYDHPPFGWITIATWIGILHDNWNFFGNSLHSGRALMFLLHLVQVSLIFFIVKRVTNAPWIAFLSIVLYSTSPLVVYFQRRILLDNLLTTWVLLSTAVLFLRQVRLRHILMSGAFFGFAMITKITTVMFGPAILYLLITAKWQLHRGFRIVGWFFVSGSLFSLWFIYAFIHTELLPAPHGERVSLIGAILYQASRGTGTYFWQQGSSFLENVTHWLILDATHVYIVGFGLVVALLIALLSSRYRFFGLATLLYFIFLIRGGTVIGFYILPMMPFLVMSLATGFALVYEWLREKRVPIAIPFCITIVALGVYGYHYYPKVYKYLTVDETTNQIEALRWMKRNIPEDARMIVDIYGMTGLLDPTFENDTKFKNAEWFFKVALDPSVRYEKYQDDWRNFDYVFISHEMIYQSYLHKLPVVYDAIRNSDPVMRWDAHSTSFIDIQNFKSTNGDWVALHRVNNNTRTQLLYAWNHFKDNFIVSYGQVIDPKTNVTTSEGQSYALLRAVMMNDHDTFKGVWLWTQHQLQHRLDDKLLSWRWKDGVQTDSVNATDADLDIALALIFASQRFNAPEYLEDARLIIADIWRQTVVDINGRYYLLPMEKTLARRDNFFLLNPSYMSPAHYRLFAEIDTERREEWLKLADDTYMLLGDTLPMNWVLINDTTGEVSSAGRYIVQGDADLFGYDAFRTFWRVGLDVEWFESEKGKRYLENIGSIFVGEWNRSKTFVDRYTANGGGIGNNPNVSVASGILLALKHGATPQLSSEVYNKLFAQSLVFDGEREYAYWGSPDVYYDANWAWFGVALYTGNFPNLWRAR